MQTADSSWLINDPDGSVGFSHTLDPQGGGGRPWDLARCDAGGGLCPTPTPRITARRGVAVRHLRAAPGHTSPKTEQHGERKGGSASEFEPALVVFAVFTCLWLLNESGLRQYPVEFNPTLKSAPWPTTAMFPAAAAAIAVLESGASTIGGEPRVLCWW